MAVWEVRSGHDIPDNAVRAGHAWDGQPLYVARAKMENEVWTPGKIGFFFEGAHIPHKGEDINRQTYAVLVQPLDAVGFYEWKRQSGGQIPYNAVFADQTTRIYVARCFHDGSLVPGKVDPDDGCAEVCNEMKVWRYNDYEVLCHIK